MTGVEAIAWVGVVDMLGELEREAAMASVGVVDGSGQVTGYMSWFWFVLWSGLVTYHGSM